ncbi:hypothetical protein F5051DRAFT_428200 [Lentinula edodes]|nr:hypothetical protein F5051DRAFT_428200 [Lentinula edodes]
MDGNAGNSSNSNTNSDQLSRLLQSFMATPNAQALEFMSQNQLPPMLLQNSTGQTSSFPAPSSNPTPSQAGTTLAQSSAPSTSTTVGPPLQTLQSSQSNQAQNLPSLFSEERPVPPLPPFNQNQPLPIASSTPLSAQWPMHMQGPSAGFRHAHSAAILPSSLPMPTQASNIEPQPLSTVGSGSTSLPPPPPPPPSQCRPYTSMQMQLPASDGYGQIMGSQGHARITTASGFPGLTAIQRTNHLRLDHASQSLPQNPRKEKKRGKAVRPPGLGRRDRIPSIDDCISVATGGIEVVTIDVLIYLPLPPTRDINFYHLPKQPIFYEINKDAYRMVLNALGLFHQYPNLPTSTTVFDLLSDVTLKLRQRYNLPSLSSSLPLAPQELLPLHLLGFSNHGRANGSYNTSKLRSMPYERNTTILNLLASNGTYVVPKLIITRDNHFQLHALIRNHPLEANVSLAQAYLGLDDTIRTHRCLSIRIYSMFRNDSDANLNTHALDEEEIEDSCQLDIDNSDAEDLRVVAQSLTIPASGDVDDQELEPQSSESSTATLVSTSSMVEQSLPKKLWGEPYIQPTPLEFIPVFFDDERTHAIFKIVAEVHRQESTCPGIRVEGRNEQELATEFILQMKISVRSGDWSKILSPNRHFVCIDDQDDYISSGPGLEQSTVTEVFRRFFEEREGEFCTPLYEEYTTLQSADLQISPSKHDDLVLFGAVTALALIYGHYPGRFNPLLLIYLLNDCNLSCLHRNLVSSYLPSITDTLDRWLNIGPMDSVMDFTSHFASYHNIQLGVLNGRSEAGHQKLAWEMLHKVIIGPVDVENAYFSAFLKGIDLVDIVRSFFGGAEEFIRTAELSTIRDFDSLNIRVVCDIGSQSLDKLADAFNIAGSYFAGKTFRDVIQDFLNGVGVPCPRMLDSAMDRLSPEVKASLSGLQSPTFRMRLMCWAVTGATRVLHQGEPMQIILVEDDDILYLPQEIDHPGLYEAYLSSGSCSFRTCSRSMRIPASYLIKLLKETYDPNGELKDARIAIHNWLLMQMLDSAGTYSMV